MARQNTRSALAIHLCALLALLPALAFAQVPVDERGEPLGATIEDLGDEDIPRLSSFELQELVGPIALYPDDLLAVVLPASTYPLQVIEAARFLEELESDPSLKPDEDWDDSIIALINYPEVVELLNEDLDWTWRLGEAVVAQQEDVIAAVETFRDRAYAAGNLESDDYQTVSRDNGVVSIEPVSDDVIYVPYYEPTRVVVRQPRPVYYYYPRPYPVYYYPYPDWYTFNRGYFWGVTTAFSIGWASDRLSVFHHSYHGHPFYGRSYRDRWWYRRPTINVYNNTYVRQSPTRVTVNRYYSGDRWRPTRNSGIVRRVTRNEYDPPRREQNPELRARKTRSTHVVPQARQPDRARRSNSAITFRQRPERAATVRRPERAATVRSPQRVVTRRPQRHSVRQVAPQPRQRQSAPQPRHRQSAPQPRQRQSAPQPRQRQSAPQPRQRQTAPQSRPRQTAPRPRQREASAATGDRRQARVTQKGSDRQRGRRQRN